MSTLYGKEVNELKKVSIRFDNSSRTYYCFYHRTDNSTLDLTLSYDLNEENWIVETYEYKNVFETKLNQLFNGEKIPFEEQVRHVIEYLDSYFAEKSQQEKVKTNVIRHRIYPSPWFRRLRGIRQWSSQGCLTETSTVLQRYSAPEKSSYTDINEQIISVKALAESFYKDEIPRNRTKTATSSMESSKDYVQVRSTDKAPSITEIWLNVITEEMDDFRKKIGSRIEEEKLKKLAEKFVKYFGGTFQCNIGHKYQLDYGFQTWHFVVLKVELMPNKKSETTKVPKTKIFFLIDGIPHSVRG